MAVANALNLTATGVVSHDGAGTFAGRTITGQSGYLTVTNGDGTAGNPTITVSNGFDVTGKQAWQGAILETIDPDVSSDGATITYSVEKSGGGDLTVVFSDGYYTWDTTPADTISLTAGTDTVPVLNYVYFLQSTKALTVSTVGWPATEHAPLATVLCQSAASLQTDLAYKNHVWTDHVVGSDDMGHLADLNFWIRQQNATWSSGVGQTFTITPNGGAADNVILETAVGSVLQLHPHTFPAFSGTPTLYVVNDSGTPYTKVTDLNALLTDANGVSMANKYFSLVIWGVVSEDTGECKLMVNLPTGSYNSAAQVTADASKYAQFDFPSDFKGTAFLIAQWNLRHQTSASGTWTSIDEIDLRGLIPSILPGGSTADTTEFLDTAFRILDDADSTKEIAFEASGITTATTRTITMADQAVDLTPNTGTYAAAAGGTQIVTLGTISTGTWEGTDVGVQHGGTGLSTLTDHGVLVGSGTAAITPLAVGTNGQVLVGSTGADPVFATLASSDSSITYATGAGTLGLTVTAAGEAQVGGAEIATQTETNTGTDDARIVTPLKLKTNLTTPPAIGGTTPNDGSFTQVVVDDITINGGTIQGTAASALTISPTAGQVLQLDNSNCTVDNGAITATSINFGDENLDTYDEGTFTPAVTGSTTGPDTITYSVQRGNYTRVGDVVHFSIYVDIATFTLGAGAGTLRISGLPFTASSIANMYHCTPHWDNLNLPAGFLECSPKVTSSSTTIDFLYSVDNGSGAGIPLSGVGATTNLMLGGFFYV